MLFDAPALSPIENTAGFDSIDFQDDIHFIRSEPPDNGRRLTTGFGRLLFRPFVVAGLTYHIFNRSSVHCGVCAFDAQRETDFVTPEEGVRPDAPVVQAVLTIVYLSILLAVIDSADCDDRCGQTGQSSEYWGNSEFFEVSVEVDGRLIFVNSGNLRGIENRHFRGRIGRWGRPESRWSGPIPVEFSFVLREKLISREKILNFDRRKEFGIWRWNSKDSRFFRRNFVSVIIIFCFVIWQIAFKEWKRRLVYWIGTCT